MMLWMPVATFPVVTDVRKDIVYGYNSEYTGALDISDPNVVQATNGELNLLPDIPTTPPGPSNGEMNYGP